MIIGHLLSGFLSRKTLGTGDEVVIDDGLVAYFDLVSFGGHAEVVRVSYEVRDVV